jgi:hypothetical protein
MASMYAACDNEITLDGLSREHCVLSDATATSYMSNGNKSGKQYVRVSMLSMKGVCVQSADVMK